jgi:hypothetical protein
MKILYIAQEYNAAEVALRALARIAPNVRVTWAPSPEAAIGWIRDNRDAQAVIAETGREDPAFHEFLEQVRSLGVTTPIAAVAAGRAAARRRDHIIGRECRSRRARGLARTRSCPPWVQAEWARSIAHAIPGSNVTSPSRSARHGGH